MIEQQGQVITSSDEFVNVRIGGASGCPACDAGKGCGAGIFGRLVGRKPTVLELSKEFEVKVGQIVIVGLPESVFLLLVMRLYLLQLLSGLAGAVIGHYIASSLGATSAQTDVSALLVTVLAASLAVVWNRNRSSGIPGSVATRLVRILDRPGSDQCAGPVPHE